MAGIVFPVVIHLWNNKQGKVLAIGSIAFLEKASRKKARSRTVSEWLLLLLRCLLLLLLALLLAGPSWKHVHGGEKKGWVLVGEAPSGGDGRVVMDSLIKVGWERHDLTGASRWADVASLDRQAAAEMSFYVFSDCRLDHFSGERPVMTRPVRWYISGGNDSAVRWVEKAWPIGRDSTGVVMGSSGTTGSTYTYEEKARRAEDRLDTSVLRVAIYADGIDGQWVGGAVKALGQFTHRRMELSVGKGGEAHPDWIFWLSAKPVPQGLKAANILFYEAGKERSVDTWVNDIYVAKEVVPDTSLVLTPAWKDGFGRPLLGLEKREEGRRWHFFSHFDPAWNGLVWSADLPTYLEALLFGKAGAGQDRRMIDPQQIFSGHGKPDPAAPVVKAEAAIDLAPAGWVLICLLLLLERILSFKRSGENG